MIDGFISYLEAERRYSPRTVDNYRREVADFMAFIERVAAASDEGEHGEQNEPSARFDPARVGRDDIRAWIVELVDGPRRLSPTSVNLAVSALRTYFRWLRKRGIVEKDPFIGVQMLKAPKRLPVWIPETAMWRISSHLLQMCGSDDPVERRDGLIVMLFYSCGMRLAELTALDAGDVAPDFRSIRVTGKGDKQRVVPLPEVTAEILKRWVNENCDSKIWISREKPLFLTHRGGRLSRGAIGRIVGTRLEALGVQGKRSPHVLRHTFATHLMDSGADMREIQELLGHASLAATQVYTHSSLAKLREVYEVSHPRGEE